MTKSHICESDPGLKCLHRLIVLIRQNAAEPCPRWSICAGLYDATDTEMLVRDSGHRLGLDLCDQAAQTGFGVKASSD